MPENSIGVAVIGAGMAGRAHAAGYRSATTLYGERPARGAPGRRRRRQRASSRRDTARRFGYAARRDASWQAVAEADDVDVVSVVVANHLHREVVEGLLAAGKHVLCEKPFAPTVGRRRGHGGRRVRGGPTCGPASASPSGAHPPSPPSRTGSTTARSGGRSTSAGTTGATTRSSPTAPMSWRYKGGPGSGALADIGSHLVDLAEFLCGPIASVRGTTFATTITERAAAARAPPSGTPRPSSATSANRSRTRTSSPSPPPSPPGATATLSASRVAIGRATRSASSSSAPTPRPPSTCPGPASSATSTAP